MELTAGRDLVALPKVHVHVHLDGSYPVDAVKALARTRGVDIVAPRTFEDVDAFYAAYLEVPRLVESTEELAALCRALVLAEAANGVVFLEPAIEPQLYAPRLGSLAAVARVMIESLQSAAAEAGIEVGANITVNTDFDLALAAELTEIASGYASRGVTALGTAGFVESASLAPFAECTDAARAAGLQIVSHAGQTGGADSVLQVLDVLGATRISHGVGAIESGALLNRLAADQIVCDVCPVSNVSLGIAATLASHPAPKLVSAGVPITLNADDELWFGKGVVDQYEIARGVWRWDDAAIASVARAGLLVGGLSDTTRSRLDASIDAWLDEPLAEEGRR